MDAASEYSVVVHLRRRTLDIKRDVQNKYWVQYLSELAEKTKAERGEKQMVIVVMSDSDCTDKSPTPGGKYPTGVEEFIQFKGNVTGGVKEVARVVCPKLTVFESTDAMV